MPELLQNLLSFHLNLVHHHMNFLAVLLVPINKEFEEHRNRFFPWDKKTITSDKDTALLCALLCLTRTRNRAISRSITFI